MALNLAKMETSLLYEVSGVKYDAKTRAAINPKETVSQRLEREGTAPWLDKFDVGGGDEGSDAADKLEKQPEAGKQLSREFELQKDLLMAKNELQKQLVQNEFDRLEAIRQIQTTAAATQQADLIKQANEVASLERSKLIADYAKDELASAQEKIEASRLLIEADARREELIAQGINPALADSLVEIEQAYDAERKQLTVLEGILTAELARVDANSEIAKELQEQLDKIKKIQGQLDEAEQQEKGKAKRGQSWRYSGLYKSGSGRADELGKNRSFEWLKQLSQNLPQQCPIPSSGSLMARRPPKKRLPTCSKILAKHLSRWRQR